MDRANELVSDKPLGNQERKLKMREPAWTD